MKNFKIKSYCKINLYLRVIKKLNSGYHNIISLITFCKLHDVISISKTNNKSDIISFSGKFKKGIHPKFNTVYRILDLLRKSKFIKKQAYKINIKKNIPHGSGLGSASSNAATLLNFFNSKMRLNLSQKKVKKLARKIGFDVPINLEKKNTFLIGTNDQILRSNRKFNLNILIVYPNLICSTKKIYQRNKNLSLLKPRSFPHYKNKKFFIYHLQNEENDLEKTVIAIYPKIKKIINLIKSQKGCYFSRISGSGSACIGIFDTIKKANYAMKMIKLKHPKYWCVVSKSI